MHNLVNRIWLLQIAKYSLIGLCIFGVYVTQMGFDEIWISDSYQRRLTQTVLPIQTNQRISLGFDNVLADIYWLNAIQYLGVGVTQGGHPALPIMLENTTKLDPNFEYPYIFSNLILPGEGYTVKAKEIAKDGIKNVPDSWKIPYYAALSIYQIQLRDYTTAAELVDLASTKKGAPESLPFIASVLRSRTNDNLKAYATWKVVYDTTTNKYSKERAKVFLDHYTIIFYLNDAIKAYQNKFGNYPDALQNLVTNKIIEKIPEDPLERGFVYQKETGEVFTNNSRRFEN